MEIKSAVFVKSAPSLFECPHSNFSEFAFVGRSNVWKSSLINMLTWKKQFAKASSVPWKTQLINFFLINESRHLVDLPWYGFARYGTNKRVERMDRMQEYLTKRKNLNTIFVLIDWSIPPQKIDLDFVYALYEEKLKFVIVITKTDKTSSKELQKNVSDLKNSLNKFLPEMPEIFFTSTEKKVWKEEILEFFENNIG